MITLQTADKALKSAYLDVVSEQLNFNINPFLAKIKQSTENVWGKDVRQVIHHGINGGIGAGDESGNLPNANSNMYEQISVPLKNLYGTIEISDKAVRASENNSGAFVNLLNAEMEGLIKASTLNLGRMLYGKSSGLLGTVVEQVEDYAVQVSNVENFVEGMTIDFYLNASLKTAGMRVTRIDRKNKYIYLTGEEGFITNEGESIYLQGSKNHELTGLGDIFDVTKNLYGLKRNQHGWLNPYIVDSVGDITEMDMQKVVDYLEDSFGSSVDMILCSSGVKRALMEHLSTYKRNVDYMELKGGFKAMSFNGIPVVSDRFCPPNTMFMLNSKDFTLHQLCDWKWLEGEDGRVLKQVADKPVYKATLVKYAELICSRPCGQAMLTGITEK